MSYTNRSINCFIIGNRYVSNPDSYTNGNLQIFHIRYQHYQIDYHFLQDILWSISFILIFKMPEIVCTTG